MTYQATVRTLDGELLGSLRFETDPDSFETGQVHLADLDPRVGDSLRRVLGDPEGTAWVFPLGKVDRPLDPRWWLHVRAALQEVAQGADQPLQVTWIEAPTPNMLGIEALGEGRIH